MTFKQLAEGERLLAAVKTASIMGEADINLMAWLDKNIDALIVAAKENAALKARAEAAEAQAKRLREALKTLGDVEQYGTRRKFSLYCDVMAFAKAALKEGTDAHLS